MSPDPTDKEDSLHAELMQGRHSQALVIANEIDVWLAAHMADIMEPLGLLESDVDDEYVWKLFRVCSSQLAHFLGPA